MSDAAAFEQIEGRYSLDDLAPLAVSDFGHAGHFLIRECSPPKNLIDFEREF
jgi:hypothetical protein